MWNYISKNRYFTVLIASVLLSINLLQAQTNVSGVISAGSTWTKAGSPYNITGNTQINAGDVLTIQPGAKIVFTGDFSFKALGNIIAIGNATDSIYFETNSTNTQLEESATGLNLVSYYAATKWVNEVLAQSHAKNYKINSVAMRFFTVYGIYGRPDMSYMTFLEKILNGDEIELFGQNGGQRSFSYVLDVANIIGSLIESETLISKLNNSTTHFEALNIGSSKTDTARSLIQILEQESQKKANIKIVERPSFDVSATSASMIKTFSYLNNKHEFTNLTDGIKEFTQWYLNDFLRLQK